MKIASELRDAAEFGPAHCDPKDHDAGWFLADWVIGPAFQAAEEYVDSAPLNWRFLANLPDNDARRTFLLLIAEALA